MQRSNIASRVNKIKISCGGGAKPKYGNATVTPPGSSIEPPLALVSTMLLTWKMAIKKMNVRVFVCFCATFMVTVCWTERCRVWCSISVAVFHIRRVWRHSRRTQQKDSRLAHAHQESCSRFRYTYTCFAHFSRKLVISAHFCNTRLLHDRRLSFCWSAFHCPVCQKRRQLRFFCPQECHDTDSN